MTHNGIILDKDPYFVIDPITRSISNKSTNKVNIIQFDHNSERFTFSISRVVEGHDMSLCDIVQVHYANVDAFTKEETLGICLVDDLRVDESDESMVTFSWLLSQDVTQRVGKLEFLVRFVCTDGEGNAEYIWNTAIYDTIKVAKGMNNMGVIEQEYPDVLSQIIDNSVGKPGENGSEIFNDYENNKTTGAYSHLEGKNNTTNISTAHIEGNTNTGTVKGYLIARIEGNTIFVPSPSGIEKGMYFNIFVKHSSEEPFRVRGVVNSVSYDSSSPFAALDVTIHEEVNLDGDYTNMWNAPEMYSLYNKLIVMGGSVSNPSQPDILDDSLSTSQHAEGFENKVGINAHVEGAYNEALGYASHCEGYKSKALRERDHAEGYKTVAEGCESHAEGMQTNAKGYASHAEGNQTVAEGHAAHAEGSQTHSEGFGSHSEGGGTHAVADQSHAEGLNTWAKGIASHAEGEGYNEAFGAFGRGSHSEGLKTIAFGDYSHAEGKLTEALGYASHCEGEQTYTDTAALGAHAEGVKTKALNEQAHAEGRETTASGYISHAEGCYSRATGSYAHAEGYTCVAEGEASHAEGKNTYSANEGSHSEGIGTSAKWPGQHAEGKWNEEDWSNKYAHIVGNGTREKRKNIHTLDWNGNSWNAGTGEYSAVILRSSTEGSTKKFKLTVDDSGTLKVTAM